MFLINKTAFNFQTFILFLSDVLEEGARQHRQVEFDVENDEEDTEEATPDAHFQKLAGIGHNRLREQKRCGYGYKALAKGHIFENGPIGKPAELLEQCAADEESLIPVNDPAADAAEIVQERDQLEPPIVARELVHEAASLDGLVRLHLVQPLNSPGRQDRVGMEKEEPLAGRLFGSSVHLGGAALWSGEESKRSQC